MTKADEEEDEDWCCGALLPSEIRTMLPSFGASSEIRLPVVVRILILFLSTTSLFFLFFPGLSLFFPGLPAPSPDELRFRIDFLSLGSSAETPNEGYAEGRTASAMI